MSDLDWSYWVLWLEFKYAAEIEKREEENEDDD